MAIDMDQIVSGVKRELYAVGAMLKGKGERNPVWTLQLKLGLSKLAQGYGFCAYASGCHQANGGEWLYDICWLLMKDDKVHDIVLVGESEWRREGIIYDFQKLLLARAHLRLMVFETTGPTQTKHYFRELKTQICSCAQSLDGDRYLFAAWEAGKEFKFDDYCHPV